MDWTELRDNGLLGAGPGGVGYAAKGGVETTRPVVECPWD